MLPNSLDIAFNIYNRLDRQEALQLRDASPFFIALVRLTHNVETSSDSLSDTDIV
jgi:hypothetical protein